MAGIRLLSALEVPHSPARKRAPERESIVVGAVQERWHPDPAEHEAALLRGIEMAAEAGAQIVCLQELTLSRYFATDPSGPWASGVEPEQLPGGPTHRFAAGAARATGAFVHASLFERASDEHELGYNTAILVSPAGEIVARTRKLHIPITAGYHEDRYFMPGPGPGGAAQGAAEQAAGAGAESTGGAGGNVAGTEGPEGFPLVSVGGARLALPTCWDQWFPELARTYGLHGADVIVYPTAIGSEPDHPDFDTEPLWERVIIGNAIANGVFMVAVNRIGEEPPLRFYGSSFICDPYGRKLVQAPRDEPAALVARLDLDQRRDWLELFPFLQTRRPDLYAPLVDPAHGGARPAPTDS